MSLSTELFLVSCRAMGKGVERVMLKTLAERALARRSEEAFDRLHRNGSQRAGAAFLRGLGGFTLDAETIAELSPVPEEREPSRGTGHHAGQ
jgi:predicted enzyme involved in methoxymalonyl-ACP biosynthesis